MKKVLLSFIKSVFDTKCPLLRALKESRTLKDMIICQTLQIMELLATFSHGIGIECIRTSQPMKMNKDADEIASFAPFQCTEL